MDQEVTKSRYNKVKFDEKIHCSSLIETMSNGKSFSYWCGRVVGMGRTKAYEWLKEYPIFKEAYEIGYFKGLAYYEDLLQACAMGIVPPELKAAGSKRIEVTALIFTLKTRFHKEYSENREDPAQGDDELEFI